MSKITLAATKRGTDRELAADLSSIDLYSVDLGVPAVNSFAKHSVMLLSHCPSEFVAIQLVTASQSARACENHNMM
jgi:hypothetical protein